MKKFFTTAIASVFMLSAASLSYASPEPLAPASAVDTSDEAAYTAGTRALHDLRWPEAVRAFDQVIAIKRSKRIDGALYWKAYALLKMSHRVEAAASCDTLHARFPTSTWNADCGALSIETDAGDGSARSAAPGTTKSAPPQADDDLKLLALNALAKQDPARAMPILRRMLTSNQTSEVREHALFALTQSRSPEAAALLQDAIAGKLGADAQISAIQAVGVFRGKRTNETLAQIYASTSDKRVKQAVVSSFFVSQDATRLVELARNEKDRELKRLIVGELALMHDKAATDYMFELLK